MTTLARPAAPRDEVPSTLGTFEERWAAWQAKGRARDIRQARWLRVGGLIAAMTVTAGAGLLAWWT